MNDGVTGNGREASSPAERLFNVQGARVIVTGAASGLGLAMAEVMAESGAAVVLADSDAGRLEEAAARLAGSGGPVIPAVVDVTDPAQVSGLFARTAERLGGVDTVFANAGIHAGGSFTEPGGALEEFPLPDWDRVLSVNLSGVFLTLRAAASLMKAQQGGSIVVTASTAGIRAEPMVSYPYVASKAAVVNVVKQAALELAPFGVRVNALAPGPFTTNIGGQPAMPPEARAAWARTIPLGRWGRPEEIKGVALFLASPAASFVTGAIWTVDGGASALTQESARS